MRESAAGERFTRTIGATGRNCHSTLAEHESTASLEPHLYSSFLDGYTLNEYELRGEIVMKPERMVSQAENKKKMATMAPMDTKWFTTNKIKRG